MPTIYAHIRLGHRVTARCLRCGRARELDLGRVMTAGQGWAELAELPLHCTGQVAEPDGPGVHPCDGRRFGFTVAARATGPQP